ncbi:hypothetical protein BC938DRAFT_477780, partial [Jimgerdemannia flammicorona]
MMDSLSQEALDNSVDIEEPSRPTARTTRSMSKDLTKAMETQLDKTSQNESTVAGSSLSVRVAANFVSQTEYPASVQVPVSTPCTSSILSNDSADSVKTLIMEEESVTSVAPPVPFPQPIPSNASSITPAPKILSPPKKAKGKLKFYLPKRAASSISSKMSISTSKNSSSRKPGVSALQSSPYLPAPCPATSAASTAHQTGIFCNTRIFFITLNIEKVRLSLFRERVLEKGGVVEKRFGPDVTHVVTELKDLQRIKEIVGVESLP